MTPLEDELAMPQGGVITAFSFPYSVGRIVLADGNELHFGTSALREVTPMVGTRVVVLRASPHPLGGLRALEVRADDAHTAANAELAAKFQTELERRLADDSARRHQQANELRERGVKPNELTSDQRASLDAQHQAIRQQQADSMRQSLEQQELSAKAKLLRTALAPADAIRELLEAVGAPPESRRLRFRPRVSSSPLGLRHRQPRNSAVFLTCLVHSYGQATTISPSRSLVRSPPPRSLPRFAVHSRSIPHIYCCSSMMPSTNPAGSRPRMLVAGR